MPTLQDEDIEIVEDRDQEYIKQGFNRHQSVSDTDELRDVLRKSKSELADIYPYTERKLSEAFKGI